MVGFVDADLAAAGGDVLEKGLADTVGGAGVLFGELFRDRDSIYGGYFRRRVKNMVINEVITAPQSPWQNPFVERLIGASAETV